jgi:DNA repair protein SbcC/Rad50
MIIQELLLNPFAGISDLKITLDQGLNVVLGPNEAGKSTIVNALNRVLFVQTHLTRREIDRDIAQFLPLGGGDYVKVSLSFLINGDSYQLIKSWGNKAEALLSLPRGGSLSDSQTVQNKLQELLQVNLGTFKSVLFSPQSGLSSTLQSLDQEPLNDLADILRRVVFETDKVSIEKLRNLIEDEHKKFYGRWDFISGRPEGNRNIDNPWKQGVGKILEAYYNKEKLQRELEKTIQFEKDMDSVNCQIVNLQKEVEELAIYISTNQQVVRDARNRIFIEVQLVNFNSDENKLKTDFTNWSSINIAMNELPNNINKLKINKEQKEEELKQAQEYQQNKMKIEMYTRAKAKKVEIDNSQNELNKMPALNTNDYEQLKSVYQELERLQTSLAAGKISISISAKKHIEIMLEKDFEVEAKQSISPGEKWDTIAAGRLQLSHPDWIIQIKSGEIDWQELSDQFTHANDSFQTLIERLGITDFNTGEKIYLEYREQQARVNTLQNEFDIIIGDKSYEDLESLSEKFQESTPQRDVAVIAEEIGKLNGEITQLRAELLRKQSQIDNWLLNYESLDNLLTLVAEKRAEINNINYQLQKHHPLPAGIDNAETFINDFETKEHTLGTKKDELNHKKIERAGLEVNAPEENREDLEPRLQEAIDKFDQTKREGEALSEIRQAFAKLKDQMDSQTLDPWLQELRKVVAPLTVDRYQTIRITDQDRKAVRVDGLEIPPQALSGATKVGLGLALRLSMARHFLKNLKGFIVLDDPLVDMDVERQQAAARIIQTFAQESQVILLTCHESHAKLLKGNTIRLNSIPMS